MNSTANKNGPNNMTNRNSSRGFMLGRPSKIPDDSATAGYEKTREGRTDPAQSPAQSPVPSTQRMNVDKDGLTVNSSINLADFMK